ncbi:MAG: two-component system sensor histidine kinase NtrB [Desulfobacca sp.]|uniref:two-component system sensor histidine kinase NtrB n=1 Tax=Desulfobacca sp. TaxID=2067990 RepID=UPI00404A43B2
MAEFDFKGLGFSKVGHFKEVRAKIKELEALNLELARRHNKLEAILNSLNDGLTILNRDLVIVFANEAQQKMFPEISLEGKKCHQAYFRKDRPCRNCPTLETMNSQEILQGEVKLREGLLAEHYLEWTTTPLRDRWGQVEEVILFMRDVTERKEYEFRLMEADRMVAIGLLADSIAHEINNPLTSIAGFAEALLNRLGTTFRPEDPKHLKTIQEYLEIINNEVHRCKDIIRQLHDFSRTSADDFSVLEIETIIQDTLSLIRQYAKHHNIKIVTRHNLANGLNRIGGNETQLKHAFLNMFYFLLETMPEGGDLIITTKNRGNMIEVALSGWQREAASRKVTGRHQCQSHPSGHHKGLPINFSICHSIVRQHRGILQLDVDNSRVPTLSVHFPSYAP